MKILSLQLIMRLHKSSLQAANPKNVLILAQACQRVNVWELAKILLLFNIENYWKSLRNDCAIIIFMNYEFWVLSNFKCFLNAKQKEYGSCRECRTYERESQAHHESSRNLNVLGEFPLTLFFYEFSLHSFSCY